MHPDSSKDSSITHTIDPSKHDNSTIPSLFEFNVSANVIAYNSLLNGAQNENPTPVAGSIFTDFFIVTSEDTRWIDVKEEKYLEEFYYFIFEKCN